MDRASLTRMRWRRAGAWMWPVLAALTAVDAVIGHALPPEGETQTLIAAGLMGLVLNLIVVVLLARPLGALIRNVRRDLPVLVARDYAGVWLTAATAAGVLAVGLAHHAAIRQHEQARRDAIARAQAWIGARAPAQFRANLEMQSTTAIEPGSMYRTCVLGVDHRHTYCVIVKTRLPLQSSVSFAGYESNAVFAGTGG